MVWEDHGKRPGPPPKRPKGRQSCTFEGCERFNFAHGLCQAHAAQKRRGVELRPVRPPRPTTDEGLRWCGRCKQFVDENEFGWDRTRDQPARTCRPCKAADQKQYVERNRPDVNLQRRLTKRGLSKEGYETLFVEQGGACAICERERPLVIDHCHKQGHVRALLCGPCNKALGWLEDDPAIVEKALAFLRHHEALAL